MVEQSEIDVEVVKQRGLSFIAWLIVLAMMMLIAWLTIKGV